MTDRDSDIMRWCDFAQLTSYRIQSHNQRKNHVITQFGLGKGISFVKCTVIQTLF